jgi:hypothetical protein
LKKDIRFICLFSPMEVPRPLDMNTSEAHIKTGNVSGFLDDISGLKQICERMSAE